MAMPKAGDIRWLVPLLCFTVAPPPIHAASSSASAQVIIILPAREPSDPPLDAFPEMASPWEEPVPAPDGSPGNPVRPAAMERSTTVIYDGDVLRILHTEFAPL